MALPKTCAHPKVIFFDAGNTLFRPYPSVGAVYGRVAKKHGCTATTEWIAKRFNSEWKKHNGLSQLKITSEKQEKEWWSDLVRAVFKKRIHPDAFGAFFDELYAVFAQPRTWKLFPDTLATLKRLKKRGIRLGVVSNWDSRLFTLCDGLGVSKYMDFILASAVVGSAKPDRGIFLTALRKARVKPKDALHVGDSLKEDYWGSQNTGIRAVLICRKDTPPKGVYSVRSLSDIVRLLK